jgi:hypothetical protein
MTESGHSSIALIIADMPSPPRFGQLQNLLCPEREVSIGHDSESNNAPDRGGR